MENWGHSIPGLDPARLAPDALSVLRVIRERCCRNRHVGQRLLQAKLGQLAGGVWQDVDADAELLHFRRGFEHLDVIEAGIEQRQRERETANAPAGNQDLHHHTPSLVFLTTRTSSPSHVKHAFKPASRVIRST